MTLEKEGVHLFKILNSLLRYLSSTSMVQSKFINFTSVNPFLPYLDFFSKQAFTSIHNSQVTGCVCFKPKDITANLGYSYEIACDQCVTRSLITESWC